MEKESCVLCFVCGGCQMNGWAIVFMHGAVILLWPATNRAEERRALADEKM